LRGRCLPCDHGSSWFEDQTLSDALLMEGSVLNYLRYLAAVRERLLDLNFAEVRPPADLAALLPLVLERQESWGRLMLALPAHLTGKGEVSPDRLVAAAAAWVPSLRREGERCYLVIGFPYDRKVGDEVSAQVLALRQEGPEEGWGVVPWVLDLEVELIDRPPFPAVENAVVRAITAVPRSGAESLWHDLTGPQVGHRWYRLDLGYLPGTRIILAATVAYYLWVLLSSGQGTALMGGPSARALLTWGANHGRLVIDGGEHWRLLTYVLLHGNLLHLGFNMWAFWNLGRHVELLYGSWRMVFIYLFAGVAGGIASTVFRPAPVVSVGASGSVLGLMGALLYFAWAMPGRRLDWRALLGPVGINLLYGFFVRGIDNYAHIGGFVGGLLAAFLAGIAGERKPWRTIATAAAALAVTLMLAGLVPLPHLPLLP
jgi:membrane associated rhomboid family serine protease